MVKRASFEDRGGGGGDKRRKSNDGRAINRSSGGSDGSSVFVGNLKYETAWQALKDHMRRAGNVDSANILQAPNGRSKGCAIVTYQHPREAKRAIQELNESELEGRTIFVQPDNGNPRDNRDRTNDSAHSMDYGVFVGNLPFECSWQALKDFFKSCGPIERAEVMEDPKTGRKKGFGLVYFATERAMENAINKFNGRDFQGRTLEVRKDKKSSSHTKIDNGTSSEAGGFRIFVGNLDFDCSWRDLKDFAQRQCGRVEHADIPKRGWGIVTFATHRDGAEAIRRLDGLMFQDRRLEVRWDRDSSNREDRPSSSSSSSSKQLYVGNLTYDCTWQNLKDAFKRFGAVSHAEVCETASGKTTGFGIVAFVKPNCAERAMNAMDGTDFQGRKLSVRWDRKPEKLEAEKSGNPNNARREQKRQSAPVSQNNENGSGNGSDTGMEMEGNPLDRALSSGR
ncbi:unnamed protein product [Pseudo-nitzschia multistriata]|uniref:RRM domain-containing protein n=1 Tax=Pseudo-nitzschia multistriata TaxID=183589 RepID=A0A448ZT90_9STRA|nr:unnamed protein product [Pseudo-nitzschia multistriata]